jgi:cobalt/nickel transport system permease protein
VRRAAGAFARFLADSLLDESIARGPGLLQTLDARAKVIALLGVLVTLTLVHSLVSLALGLGVAILAAALARIPAQRLLRAWLTVPLVSLLAVLPAALGVFTPGAPILHLGPWAVTDTGVAAVAHFALRVFACVTLAVVLTLSTPPERLLQGLRGLGVPTLVIMLLAMMQRYILVFARAAEELHMARMSRSIIPGPLKVEQAWVAAGMGTLFHRTRALGEEVFHAMIARGFTGEVRLLASPRWRANEWVLVCAAAGVAVVLLALR